MPKIQLDAIDVRILNELQADGGRTNAELAERVGLSPSPCLRRVKLLTEAGILKQRVALVEGAAIDLSVSVFVHVTLEKQGFHVDVELVLESVVFGAVEAVAGEPAGLVVVDRAQAEKDFLGAGQL